MSKHNHGYSVSQLRPINGWGVRQCIVCHKTVMTWPARFVLALLFVLVVAIVYGITS